MSEDWALAINGCIIPIAASAAHDLLAVPFRFIAYGSLLHAPAQTSASMDLMMFRQPVEPPTGQR
ncbi:hypothetical protein [Rhodopila sp.]|uniref:hypothetical protein n=1 Tax=Rhodopila sp. TaxID=2480087 RepID=UPI003D10191A